jgi:biotin-(acetyl-CoA carboxylase) ligase
VRLPGQSTETDPGTLAVGLHEHLLARVDAAASTPERLRREWRCRAIDLGRPVVADRLGSGVRGRAVDVTRDGALLVATTDGRTRLRSPVAVPDG